MESNQTSLRYKYADMTDQQLIDTIKHLATQWFSNDEILLLEELFRRNINAKDNIPKGV